MKLSVPIFKGEAPRVSPRALPPEMAQRAVNCRLLTGDLRAWRNFRTEAALCKGADVNTIYLLDGQYWLEWDDDDLASDAVEVDVAKSTVAGDTTGRIYFTGTDVPRWTDVQLATTGVGCYPIESRPLGVIAPTEAPLAEAEVSVADPGTDIDDEGNQLDENWTYSPSVDIPNIVSIVQQDNAVGNPAPSYYIEYANNVNRGAYAYRDFGIGNSASATFECQFMIVRTPGPAAFYEATFRAFCSAGGVGPFIKLSTADLPPFGNDERIYVGTQNGWGTNFSPQLTTGIGTSLSDSTWYTMRIDQSRSTQTGTATLTITILLGSAVVYTTQVTTTISGGYCGIEGVSNFTLDRITTWYDNFNVTGSAPFQSAEDSLSTSYVYTFINDQGEESAPSPASDIIIRDDGTQVTVTTTTSVPSGYDYNIIYKRIYRAVTSASGTAFLFVAEIYLASAVYVDTLTNAQLGEELESSNWDLPPSNLRGILALPNDIYVGFFENTLCFSVQGRPHAWPVEFRLATDARIVGIGNIDTTVVIFTVGFPYLASGNTPDGYSMTKLEVPQGCVSKRSIAYLKGIGVVGATPDGLMAIAGPGAVQIITEPLFDRKNWQDLNPSSLIATAHDDRYVAFYDNGSPEGMLLELRPGGFGKVTLGFHAQAVFSDLETDNLYLVLDENNTPAGVSGQIAPNGTRIYEFDAESPDSGLTTWLPFSWLSKVWQLPHPEAFQFWMMRALDYGQSEIEFYADGVLYHAADPINPNAARLPLTVVPNAYEVRLLGYGMGEVISGVEVADDVEEFVL